MARLLLLNPGKHSPDLVRKALDVTWAGVPEHQQVSLLPWIGFAEADWTLATGQPSPRAASLQAMKDLLATAQVSGRSLESEPDLAGGYSLTTRSGGRPTAQGLRPGSWLARDLSQPTTAPEDAPPPPRSAPVARGPRARERGGDGANAGNRKALEQSLQFARFLMQLGVTPDQAWAYKSSVRAMGGIRESLWDSEMALPAQALPIRRAA